MTTEAQIERLRSEVFGDGSTVLVRTYFTEHEVESGNHTGRWFGRLGGVSDESPDSDPDRFTPVDLAAVSTLGEPVPGAAALQLLGVGANATTDWPRLFANVPVELHVSSPEGRALLRGRTTDGEPRSAARELWHALLAIDGIDRAMASRLLHRKRPKLLPITDALVETMFGTGDEWWAAVADWFEDPSTLGDLVALREQALEGTGVSGGEVSLVRMIHVVLWMRHRSASVPVSR